MKHDRTMEALGLLLISVAAGISFGTSAILLFDMEQYALSVAAAAVCVAAMIGVNKAMKIEFNNSTQR